MRKLLMLALVVIANLSVVAQTDYEKLYKEGTNFLKEKNYQKAKEAFATIINSKPDNQRLMKYAYIWRSKSNANLNDYDEAIKDITEAIKIDSSDYASFIDRGKMYKDSKKAKEAIQDYDYVLNRDSTSNQAEAAFYYKALILYYQGEYKTSESCCSKALKLDAELYDVRFLRSSVYGMLFEFKNAIKDLDKIIAKYPDYKEAYTNRATNRINLNKGLKDRMEKSEVDLICADLTKALALGDKAAEDMHFVFCSGKLEKIRKEK